MKPPKLLSARASIRTALTSATPDTFPAANNPDALKFGTKKPAKKKQKASISAALSNF